MMTVDVIIPMYNGGAFIAETLASVFRQTVRPERVIVVDDGSTDGSMDIVSNFAGVTLLRNPGKGSASARNHGLAHARSPLVSFLDYDDLWHPRHLELLHGILAANPDFPVAAAGLKSFPHGSRPGFIPGARAFDSFDPWGVYATHDVGCAPSASLFRRREVEETGGWREEHDPIADYSLWMRLAIDRPVLRSKVVTVGYRRHPYSISSTYYRKDPLRYLGVSLRTDDDLLEAFLSSERRGAEEKELMIRRNRAAHRLIDMLRAIIDGNMAGAVEAARLLEEAVAGEDVFYRHSLFKNFMYMHEPFYRPGQGALVRRDLIHLLESLPEGAALTRRVVTGIIVSSRPGRDFFIRYFGRKPWQVRRLMPLVHAVRRKLCAKSH